MMDSQACLSFFKYLFICLVGFSHVGHSGQPPPTQKVCFNPVSSSSYCVYIHHFSSFSFPSHRFSKAGAETLFFSKQRYYGRRQTSKAPSSSPFLNQTTHHQHHHHHHQLFDSFPAGWLISYQQLFIARYQSTGVYDEYRSDSEPQRQTVSAKIK